MAARLVYQTQSSTVGHWSQDNDGLLTECGSEVYSRAPKIVKMTCGNCTRVVKARQGRAISNGKRAR